MKPTILVVLLVIVCGCVTARDREVDRKYKESLARKAEQSHAEEKAACAARLKSLPDVMTDPDFDPTGDEYVELGPNCEERDPTPNERCTLIVKMKPGVNYFECLKYYDEKQDRQASERRAERQRAIERQQDEDDAGDQAIADALYRAGDGFRNMSPPPPVVQPVNCTSQTIGTTVHTNCR